MEFQHSYITTVTTKCLEVGDYAVEFKDGYVPPVRFERKSIADLYGTMGKGYPRFKNCINYSITNNIKLFIIIEGVMTKVAKGYEYSKLKGSSMMLKLFTLWLRHGVQPIFCKNRSEMSEYITQYFISVGKEYVRGKRK